MRTPGSDVELAQGFLLTEAIIAARSDIASIRYCASRDATGANTYNVLAVELAAGVALIDRNFYTTSSCGVCGMASLDAIRQRTRHPPAADPIRVDTDVIIELPSRLRAAQKVFAADGRLLAVREDVGRHNAVDKLIDWAVERDRIPLRGTVLLVSGRASFELAQKAVMAGIPVLAAVSAPSSLAVELAHESGLTLIGFLRGSTMNVYAHPERITNT
jgi:FdhD protein